MRNLFIFLSLLLSIGAIAQSTDINQYQSELMSEYKSLLTKDKFNQDRINEIKLAIRSKTTPRHVPRHVIQVNDIPYTRSGKKIEGVVGNLINGRPVNNIEAIINPECLEEYQMISVTNFT